MISGEYMGQQSLGDASSYSHNAGNAPQAIHLNLSTVCLLYTAFAYLSRLAC